MPIETAEALRQRVIAAAEVITGTPFEHWSRVIGPVRRIESRWFVSTFCGDPTDEMIGRRIADEVARHWQCSASSMPDVSIDLEIAFGEPAAHDDRAFSRRKFAEAPIDPAHASGRGR